MNERGRPVETHIGTDDNPTLKILLERGSCRLFEDRPIDEELLDGILAAGVQAPSGGSLLPYSILRVRDGAVRKELARLCGGQMFIATAPVSLIFCVDLHRNERWAKLMKAPYRARDSFRHFWIAMEDTVICAQTVAIAADAAGLGSVYIGTIIDAALETRRLFKLPEGVFPVVLLCLGHPRFAPVVTPRLPLDVLVHDEVYRVLSDEELLKAQETRWGGQVMEATEARLERLKNVSAGAHGADFAEQVLKEVKESGQVNWAQHIFGLHYPADEMTDANGALLEQMREAGLRPFETIQGPEPPPSTLDE